jgi:hypothetical protein
LIWRWHRDWRIAQREDAKHAEEAAKRD